MSYEDRAANIPTRMIGEKRRRVQRLRDLYYKRTIDQEVSGELVKELASVSLEYWSILREFRDLPAVDEEDLPDMGPIQSRLGETVQIVTESKRRGAGQTTEEVPAVQELNPQYLVEVTHELDDLAQLLGFGAAASADDVTDEISKEHLQNAFQPQGHET